MFYLLRVKALWSHFGGLWGLLGPLKSAKLRKPEALMTVKSISLALTEKNSHALEKCKYGNYIVFQNRKLQCLNFQFEFCLSSVCIFTRTRLYTKSTIFNWNTVQNKFEIYSSVQTSKFWVRFSHLGRFMSQEKWVVLRYAFLFFKTFCRTTVQKGGLKFCVR